MSNRDDRRFTQIGIDRLVRLEWLEQTAELAMAGHDLSTIREALVARLEGHFPTSDATVRGSLSKTLTILLRVWASTDLELEALRLDGLQLMREYPGKYQLAIHWAMLSAVYPFWGNVATSVGRLLRLQSDVTAAQVQRRLKEQYGERETVSRRVRYVLRAFVDWGVLGDSTKQGTYVAAPQMVLDQPVLVSWVLEALLMSRPSGSIDLQSFHGNPALFPFEIPYIPAAHLLSNAKRLSLVRHGVDQELVMVGS